MANIGTGTADSNGIQRLSSNDIVFAKYIDVSTSTFYNPDSTYYGYAADGFYREAGVAVTTPASVVAADLSTSISKPAKASWAVEGEHTSATMNRNLEDAFPKRIFVIATALDLVILDADNLTVWMRFTLALSAARPDWTFLGGTASTIVDADFSEGVLIVAMNDSVPTNTRMNTLIADFRSDEMLIFSEGVANVAIGKTISDRNTASVWPGSSAPWSTHQLSYGSSTNAIPGISINAVSAITNLNKTFIVSATHAGLSLTTLKIGSTGYLASDTKNIPQSFIKTYTGVNYNAVDDLDGDILTARFTASNSASWVSDKVRPGDILYISSSLFVRIDKIEGSELVLSLEVPISLSATGGTYSIYRPVSAAHLQNLSSLIYANGENQVTQQQDQTYQSTPNSLDPWTAPDYSANTPSTGIEDLQVRGTDLYVATDIGVYRVQMNDNSSGLPSSLDYSSSGGSGRYGVLSNDLVSALAVDVESGHLLVATYDGSSSSEVVEIDVDNLHQIVKATTGGTYTTKIKSLLGYANPSGPPTVSVS